jgi:DNA repair exonuclease SbcCD ATPase subunit
MNQEPVIGLIIGDQAPLNEVKSSSPSIMEEIMNLTSQTEKDSNMVRDQALTSDLESKFKALKACKAELADECLEIDAEIARLQEIRKEIEAEYKISELEAEIKEAIIARGSSYKCSAGSATFRKGSKLIKWNDEALLGYAAVHPEIEPFRQESYGKPSVVLKVD